MKRTGVTVLAAAAVAATTAFGIGTASADFGDLTLEGCIEDQITPQNICDGNVGLFGAGSDVTIGPEGTSAYSVSFQQDRVTHFSRDAESGALTYVTCFDDVDVSACPAQVPGLNGVQHIAITADGTSLYASSQNDDALVEFARDPATGALEYGVNGSCYDDEDTNLEASCTNVKALDSAQGVALSADGQSVYVASGQDDAIAHFDRNASGTEPVNGNLNQDIDNPCLVDGGTLEDGCDPLATSLTTPGQFAISADDESLYLADRNGSTIVILNRDTPPDLDPGDLTEIGTETGGDGLGGVASLTIGPEDDSLYATSANDEALVRFERQSDGQLDPQYCFEDDDAGADDPDCEDVAGLAGVDNDGPVGPNAIAIPPDGRSLYVASASDHAITRFSRDPVDGSIEYLGCIDDAVDGLDTCDASVPGLGGVTGLTPAGDSTLYASVFLDQAIATFSRELDPVPPGPGPGIVTPPITGPRTQPMKKCKKKKRKKGAKKKCKKRKKKAKK
jgi:6-phosphogluconolactonase (cycloisomerase 2 family)